MCEGLSSSSTAFPAVPPVWGCSVSPHQPPSCSSPEALCSMHWDAQPRGVLLPAAPRDTFGSTNPLQTVLMVVGSTRGGERREGPRLGRWLSNDCLQASNSGCRQGPIDAAPNTEQFSCSAWRSGCCTGWDEVLCYGETVAELGQCGSGGHREPPESEPEALCEDCSHEERREGSVAAQNAFQQLDGAGRGGTVGSWASGGVHGDL